MPPPRFTLFPYTTLFRSCTAPQSCGGGGTANVCGCTPTTCAAQGKSCGSIPDGCSGTLSCGSRSEEHTSELQSRQYLVCRLLLEKKKKPLQKHHELTPIL